MWSPSTRSELTGNVLLDLAAPFSSVRPVRGNRAVSSLSRGNSEHFDWPDVFWPRENVDFAGRKRLAASG